MEEGGVARVSVPLRLETLGFQPRALYGLRLLHVLVSPLCWERQWWGGCVLFDSVSPEQPGPSEDPLSGMGVLPADCLPDLGPIPAW